MGETEFGPYRLASLLGRGGMGEVWRAVDTDQGGRTVALKVLAPWLSGDDDFVRRFRREAEMAAGLSAPNIVPIHRYGEIDGRLFIDMAYVDGTDLAVLLAAGPLPPARAVLVIEQVADALDVAHGAGLVHRDVKPANVLLTGRAGREHAYLIDFGIARVVDATRISVTGVLIGTVAYMAPECFDGGGDRLSDVYALGCVLHQMLTGHPPFRADGVFGYIKAHGTTPPPRPTDQDPSLPAAIDAVVARAMAKDPAQRYGSAGELARAAAAALAVPPPHPTLPSVGARPSAEVTRTLLPPRFAVVTEAAQPRRPRTGLIVAVSTLVVASVTALFLGGVLVPDRSAAPTGAPAPTSTPTSTTSVAAGRGVTTAADVFGPACSLLPQGDAPGSLNDMGVEPVATAAAHNPLLTTFVTAAKAVPGLVATLDQQKAITVFAPYNAAFDDVARGVGNQKLTALLENPVELGALLSYHIVPNRYAAEDLDAAGRVTELAGGDLTIGGSVAAGMTVTDGAGSVAKVLCGNIPTSNATLFIIDKVLMPG